MSSSSRGVRSDKSLNLLSGAPVATKRGYGVCDDTTDSIADCSADHGNGFGLDLSGATHGDVIVEWIWALVPCRAQQRSFDRISENMVVVGGNPIRDHLMGIRWG